MDAKRWGQIKEIYDHALDLCGDECEVFLVEACGDDTDLRREAETLLAAHEDAGTFLQPPAFEIAARELAGQSVSGAQTPPLANPAPQRIGAYRLLEPLGHGGMGEVHLAIDRRLNRKVAVKLLPAEFTTDSERVRRFQQEAEAASAINHPNIITIHEINVDERTYYYYIVTEYVEGETLRQRLANAPEKQMKLAEALDVAAQVAAALAAAHEAGIMHRDIKPENVMVRRDGIVKVLDFGLAKLTEAASPITDSQAPTLARHSTEAGTVMGTPRYMSPEQARGEKVDARTDIFSLGVVVYEMLAGRAPFTGATASDCIAAILKEEPPELSETNHKVTPQLEKIVRRCLEKQPERRFQSASDLGFALEALSTSSGAKMETARALSVRKREWLAWVAVVLLVGMLGFVWAYFTRQSLTNDARVMRFSILPPVKRRLLDDYSVINMWLQFPATRPAAPVGWSSGATALCWRGPLTQTGSISPASHSRSQTRLGVMLFPAITPPFPSQTTACWSLIRASTVYVANTCGWIVVV